MVDVGLQGLDSDSPIQTVIPKHEEKEKFIGRCKTDTVVLYDECSAEWPASGAPASVLFVLLQKLWEDGCKAFYLEGGFVKFNTEYPEHCETLLDSSCPSSSPPVSALGFGNLRISSDCSDGESTEPEESPFPSNQPDFPVQILPYLYLGCAKDSANLDVLGQYNITYILNVTPNLPNMFEHDGHFRYKQIPISDHWSQNLSQFFPEAISFIGTVRFTGEPQVAVHRSRSPPWILPKSRSLDLPAAYLQSAATPRQDS